MLPVGVLQGFYFNKDRPMYMNYGALGSVIAREMSYIFVEGKNYDRYGNLMEWWTSDTYISYSVKAFCISEQYVNFTIPEIDRNVSNTKLIVLNHKSQNVIQTLLY